MRRILVIHWPTWRSTAGSSFGPMTRSATTPMMTSLPHEMSNMGFPTIRGAACYRKRPFKTDRADAAGQQSAQRALDALLGIGAPLHRRRGIVDHFHAVGL